MNKYQEIFFKRKKVVVPTWRFWILLLVGVVSFFYVCINYLAVFLAQNAPVKADLLVVEGWMSTDELEQAVNEFQKGEYRLVITTGGPESKNFNSISENYAQQAADFLAKKGVPNSRLISVPTPASAQDRTYLSAVMVRKAIESARIKSISSMNVMSSGVHARRTYNLYQCAFRYTNIKIGILRAVPSRYNLNHWWATSEGAKTVLIEAIGWLYMHLRFTAPKVDSHEEIWGGEDR